MYKREFRWLLCYHDNFQYMLTVDFPQTVPGVSDHAQVDGEVAGPLGAPQHDLYGLGHGTFTASRACACVYALPCHDRGRRSPGRVPKLRRRLSTTDLLEISQKNTAPQVE